MNIILIYELKYEKKWHLWTMQIDVQLTCSSYLIKCQLNVLTFLKTSYISANLTVPLLLM